MEETQGTLGDTADEITIRAKEGQASARGDPRSSRGEPSPEPASGDGLSLEAIERISLLENALMKTARRRAHEALTGRADRELDARLRIENRESVARVIREVALIPLSVLLIVVGAELPDALGVGATASGLAGGATSIGLVYRQNRPGAAGASKEGADRELGS